MEASSLALIAVLVQVLVQQEVEHEIEDLPWTNEM